MSPNNADETSYLWESIPRELWNQARAKAIAERTSIKAVLRKLLEGWVAETTPAELERRPAHERLAP